MPFAPGFAPKWRDFPDYILGITHEIWEERRIDRLVDYYAPDLIVRSPASVVVGHAGVIAATQATLAEFPDRALPGEDVIWCDDAGLMSSHRLMCWATHGGPGVYGAATGRRVCYRILADCFCAENQVRDEWLVRDQAAIVHQMGADVVDWTRALIAREGGPAACVRPFSAATDLPGPYQGRGNEDAQGAELAGLLGRLLAGEFAAVAKGYDRAAELFYPGGQISHGHRAAQEFWLGLRAALPSATAYIDHVIGRQDPGQPPRAAVRWRLVGRHDGPGRFGAPCGAEITVLGITHAEFGPHGLRREWTLIDDTALWKQILLATGQVDTSTDAP